ncbi:cyclic AMP-dependent transcription factor ATF-6 beta-like isoform X2 [Symsagittifera roscoffensis]|uniref:cyclic AMP-dependent transcription factor ATF-6 beta-like isoform X2 n=1 Tax=Symsagittifera roscoffensis TaxID=84072 RepID=UPI00307BFDA1
MAATTSTASHVQMTSRTAIKNRSCQSLSSHTSDLDSCGESDSAEIPSVAVKAEYEENRGDEETDVGSPIQSALLHNYTRAAGREVGNLFVDTSTVTSQLSQSLVTGGGVANSAIGLHLVQVGNGQLALTMQSSPSPSVSAAAHAHLMASSKSPPMPLGHHNPLSPGNAVSISPPQSLSLANFVSGSLSGIPATSVPISTIRSNLHHHISAMVPAAQTHHLTHPHHPHSHLHGLSSSISVASAVAAASSNASKLITSLPLHNLDSSAAAAVVSSSMLLNSNKLLRNSPTESLGSSFLSSAGGVMGGVGELGVDVSSSGGGHGSDNQHSSDTSPISNNGGSLNQLQQPPISLSSTPLPLPPHSSQQSHVLSQSHDIKGYLLQDSSLIPQSMNTLSLFAPLPLSPLPQHSLQMGGGGNNGGSHSDVGQSNGPDGAKKREMRLYKNREAARECRRKKKEYLRCLENRVQLLESQNKSLIEELRLLKEHYQAKEHQLYSTSSGSSTATTAAGASRGAEHLEDTLTSRDNGVVPVSPPPAKQLHLMESSKEMYAQNSPIDDDDEDDDST